MKVTYRSAEAKDAEAIAQLHADSWKKHYRGICPDAYLDNEVDAERLKIWTQRLSNPSQAQITLMAYDENSVLCGFVCTYKGHHPEWGAYLDNLHVHSAYQGKGIGRGLMKEVATRVHRQGSDSSLYLHVLVQNQSAIGFYEKIGGQLIASKIEEMPWGTQGEINDYLWSLDQLM